MFYSTLWIQLQNLKDLLPPSLLDHTPWILHCLSVQYSGRTYAGVQLVIIYYHALCSLTRCCLACIGHSPARAQLRSMRRRDRHTPPKSLAIVKNTRIHGKPKMTICNCQATPFLWLWVCKKNLGRGFLFSQLKPKTWCGKSACSLYGLGFCAPQAARRRREAFIGRVHRNR